VVHYHALSTHIVEQVRLRRQWLADTGVRPTLGVLTARASPATTVLNGFCDQFLMDLADAAKRADVVIRHVEFTPSEDGRRFAAADELVNVDSGWTWNRSVQWRAALGNLQRAVNMPSPVDGHPAPSQEEPATASNSGLAEWIRKQRDRQVDSVRAALRPLVDDESIHGLVCPPPRPSGISLRRHLAPLIPVEKDVDGAHPESLAALLGARWNNEMILSDMAVHAKRLSDAGHISSAAVNMIVLATMNAALRTETVKAAIREYGE
jgi:hypothetical protein